MPSFKRRQPLWVRCVQIFDPLTRDEEDELRDCLMNNSDPRSLSSYEKVKSLFTVSDGIATIPPYARTIALNILGRKGGPNDTERIFESRNEP